MLNRVDVLTWAIAAAGAGLLSGIADTASAAEVRRVAATCTSVGAPPEGKRPCCFSNPSYSGVCQVKPGDEETCSSILAYLNTALSTGKSYCTNTDIRGGWQQVACEKEEPGGAAGFHRHLAPPTRGQPSLYSTILR